MLTAAITSRPTRRVGSFGLLIPGAAPDTPASRPGDGRYDRPVIPALVVAAGAVALASGWVVLRRLGPRFRVGRLLASTPAVSIAEARAIAARGGRRYVGIRGRIDSESEFEDDAHRPLVLRRTRLEIGARGRWVPVEDHREAVPFEVAEGTDRIAVEADALRDGLVVVVREATGAAGDVPDRVPAGTGPATPVRLRIELVSSVEHAIVLGVPSPDGSGGSVMRPGLGRPLVLTTLEPAEAMRVLAGDHRRSTVIATALMAVGLVAGIAGVLLWIVDALA